MGGEMTSVERGLVSLELIPDILDVEPKREVVSYSILEQG